MRNLHIKKGEYIYIQDKATGQDFIKLVLIEINEKQLEVGLFNYLNKTPEMKVMFMSFGVRYELCGTLVTVNALKAGINGANFAVSAAQEYLIENDFLRNRKQKQRKLLKA